MNKGNHFDAQNSLSEVELDVTKGDTKSIWTGLENVMVQNGVVN